MQLKNLYPEIIIYIMPLIALIILMVNRKKEIIVRCFDAIRITFSITLMVSFLYWGRLHVTISMLMLFASWSLAMGITLFILYRSKENH